MPKNDGSSDKIRTHNPQSTLTSIPEVVSVCDAKGFRIDTQHTAVLETFRDGYWETDATLTFGKNGNVGCDKPEHALNDLQKAALLAPLLGAKWPELMRLEIKAGQWRSADPPQRLKDAAPGSVVEIRDEKDRLEQLLQRIDHEDGSKDFVPWTHWSDGLWRCMAPDEPWSFYNSHRLGESSTVFLHEGCGGAIRCQAIADGDEPEHPWAKQLVGATHLGWIGGAYAWLKQNWPLLQLKGVTHVIIVGDNDAPGRNAIWQISKQLARWDIRVSALIFNSKFPERFDLANNFPSALFDPDQPDRYIGPEFDHLVRDATYATYEVPQASATGRPLKPLVRVRRIFAENCFFIGGELEPLYGTLSRPNVIQTEKQFNRHWRHVSHTDDLAARVRAMNSRPLDRLGFRPDGLRFYEDQDLSVYNMFKSSGIKPMKGDVSLFEQYLAHLFQEPEERHQAKRWLATLIAKPEVRMGWGMLLVSNFQGSGKSTFLKIIRLMLGSHNVSIIDADQITNSPFNEWAFGKRAVLIQEIYSGETWKAYHKLKSYVTDDIVPINKKFFPLVNIENWLHLVLCSNSHKALKIENGDRRWFIPRIAERTLSLKFWIDFHAWLNRRGPWFIAHWAQEFVKDKANIVQEGERAPDTARKQEMVEASKTLAQQRVDEIVEMIIEKVNDKDRPVQEPITITVKHVQEYLKEVLKGEFVPNDLQTIRKWLEDAGMTYIDKRHSLGDRKFNFCIYAKEGFKFPDEPKEVPDELRKHLISLKDFYEETF